HLSHTDSATISLQRSLHYAFNRISIAPQFNFSIAFRWFRFRDHQPYITQLHMPSKRNARSYRSCYLFRSIATPKTPYSTEPGVLPLLDDADADVQVQALGILARIGAVDARSKSAAKLNDRNPAVRAAAASALGGLGNDDAATSLLATLLTDPDQNVRIHSTL